MKKTFTWFILGALTLALAAFGFVTAQAKPETAALLQATTAATATLPADTNDNNVDSGLVVPAASSVVVWDQFCVKKIPYTILALPENASFEVVQPEILPTVVPGGNSNDIACESVGTFRNKHVVVCRGPQLYSFTMHVTDGGTTEDFQVPLKACPIPRPTQ